MTITANKSSPSESQTESCQAPLYSAISKHSSVRGTPTHIRNWLTSLLLDSPANPLASLERARPKTTLEICGQPRSMSFAEYDHDSRTWRTHQASLLETTFDEFTETWPKAGMTVGGAAYPLPKQEPRISAIGGGVLLPTLQGMARKGQWPTPKSSPSGPDFARMNREGSGGDDLATAVARFATPTVQDAANNAGPSQYERNSLPLNAQIGGPLNPTWVEWLMGWPIGWTALEPLEMDKFQQWLEMHGICSQTRDPREEDS